MTSKNDLRRLMSKRRKELLPPYRHAYAQRINEAILDQVHGKDANVTHSYLPIGTEINVLPALRALLDMKKVVICPKISGPGKMEHLILEDINKIREDQMGTYIPSSGKLYSGKIDLILVPGLAFDQFGNRLGYGGGFYDQFLAQHPRSFKVGIAYPFQVIPAVPIEEHDLQVDKILYFDAL